jgi:tight adherence protein B
MMRRALLALVAAAGSLLFVAGAPALATASAQDTDSALGIRDVDSTDPSAVEVTFFYTGERDALADLTVREDGNQVEFTPAVPLDDQQDLGVVLVIDSSKSMEENALIERVREAAHVFVDSKAPTDQIAVVSFDGDVTLVEDFTTDADALNEAIDSIALEENTSLWDGIVRAARLYDDSSLQPNLIVFSDGADNASTATADQAEAAVTGVGGTLFAVGVENSGFDELTSVVRTTGGEAVLADDAEGVGVLFEDVQQTLRKQYVTTFVSEAPDAGAIPVQLTVGNDSDSVEYVPGSDQQGAASLQPVPVEEPSGPDFFRSPAGLAIALAFVAVAVIAVAFSIGSSFFGNDGGLRQALRPYSEGYVADPDVDVDDGGDGKGQHLAQTPLLQRAVEATGTFAEKRGFLTKVESMLERANLPLRPPEAIFFYAAGVAVVALLLFGVADNPFVALIGVVIVALLPPAVISYLGNRRRKQFEALLPDTLQLLASTMRAGYSLMQGVEAVSQEVSEPMGRELRRVVTEARLGRPLEEALDGIASRMDSGDFAWAVMAIRIQREVGGNLAELLVTVAETMTERERLRRDVNALTAEGKISAIVLGLLPIGLGLFIYTANPGYMDPLFDETIGKIMLFGSILLALFGFYWMKKTIEVDI